MNWGSRLRLRALKGGRGQLLGKLKTPAVMNEVSRLGPTFSSGRAEGATARYWGSDSHRQSKDSAPPAPKRRHTRPHTGTPAAQSPPAGVSPVHWQWSKAANYIAR